MNLLNENIKIVIAEPEFGFSWNIREFWYACILCTRCFIYISKNVVKTYKQFMFYFLY